MLVSPAEPVPMSSPAPQEEDRRHGAFTARHALTPPSPPPSPPLRPSRQHMFQDAPSPGANTARGRHNNDKCVEDCRTAAIVPRPRIFIIATRRCHSPVPLAGMQPSMCTAQRLCSAAQ